MRWAVENLNRLTKQDPIAPTVQIDDLTDNSLIKTRE